MERDRRGEGSHRSYRELRYAFGRQVLTLRTSVSLTQSALAAAIGVHRRTVQNWETGESYPKAETLQRLLVVFIQQQAFTLGNERAEAHALWSQAAQDGPHALAAFDDAWFERALASSTAPPPAPALSPQLPIEQVPAATAPTSTKALIDWGEAMAVPTLYGRDNELGTLHDWVVDERCQIGRAHV